MICGSASGQRDVYLLFKLLNVSHTGLLSEEEFTSIYDVVSLKWKVTETVRLQLQLQYIEEK